MEEKENHLADSKRVFIALNKAVTKLEAIERAKTEPIAIVGMACRFPGGANDPEKFWQLLSKGVDAITEIPPQRWDVDAYYDPNPEIPGKMYTHRGGFLDDFDVSQFDPGFFGISPREAIAIDPQHRLFLEVCWQALENAGQIPQRSEGSPTGVFVGITAYDYALPIAQNMIVV
ncbi:MULTISPECIES: polyketide synthase [Okeania]|uniref:polyketide synthase n=1 Tax=Okeania TaxID=1458928 RepID=UPI00142AFDE0|nr:MULTISPECIES: polyketide synthase [Okeania]NES90424.1 polyketide synthase [Okeania sp. SIO2B9]